jgi:hypothetical protein
MHQQIVCKMGAQNVDARPEACQIGNLKDTVDSFGTRQMEQIILDKLWLGMRPTFSTLNQNPSYKAKSKQSIPIPSWKKSADWILHCPRSSNRLSWPWKSWPLTFRMIDYLQKGQTITGEYYASELELQGSHEGKPPKKVCRSPSAARQFTSYQNTGCSGWICWLLI